MSESGVFYHYDIFYITTTAFCGFRSVFSACSIIVVYIVFKVVSESFYGLLLYKHFIATAAMFAFC